MQTRIPATLLERPEVRRADEILRSCVHCGFCTAVCPTYQELGDELDGPRGRIYLIKEMLETDRVDAAVTTHLDRCLTCRSCETTCPSGVAYGELLDIGRGIVRERQSPPVWRKLKEVALRMFLPSRLFPVAYRTGQLFRPLLPGPLRKMVYPARQSVRRDSAPATNIDAIPSGERIVVVLEGCAQKGATPGVTAAIHALLSRQNVIPLQIPSEGCCGALDYHLGEHEAGRARMRALVDLLYPLLGRVEAIISSASGCGVSLKDYGELLADDPDYAERAAAVADHIRDASEWFRGTDFACEPARVAVHTPCTLQHGQRLPNSVQMILRQSGFEIVPTAEEHLCCGSAGTYSVLQPELSRRLRDRKLANLGREKPDYVVTANVGCQLHLGAASDRPVLHWLELVADRTRLGE